MPLGMSIEKFKAGVSRIRNLVIVRVFGELELVEEWGSGYKRIKEVCQKGGYPEPIWEELGTFYGSRFILIQKLLGQSENVCKILSDIKNEFDNHIRGT